MARREGSEFISPEYSFDGFHWNILAWPYDGDFGGAIESYTATSGHYTKAELNDEPSLREYNTNMGRVSVQYTKGSRGKVSVNGKDYVTYDDGTQHDNDEHAFRRRIKGFNFPLENITVEANPPAAAAEFAEKVANSLNLMAFHVEGGRRRSKRSVPKKKMTKRKIHIGPKGGKYYVKNGRKVYV